MMAGGALEEVSQLSALQLDPALPLMGALGVASLRRHNDGLASLEEAVAAAKAETRQYAKRQLTWARGNMIAWIWISAQETEINSADFVTNID